MELSVSPKPAHNQNPPPSAGNLASQSELHAPVAEAEPSFQGSAQLEPNNKMCSSALESLQQNLDIKISDLKTNLEQKKDQVRTWVREKAPKEVRSQIKEIDLFLKKI